MFVGALEIPLELFTSTALANGHRAQAIEKRLVLGSLYEGNALEILRRFPDNKFRACVTSPPYWGLRDYGINGQIGAEMDVDEYVDKLVAVFDEVRRVLTSDGTFWLNVGDSYTSGGRTWRDSDKKNVARAMSYRAPTPAGLKPKDLVGVPWRLAFALQAKGWYLRSDLIWHKPNGVPESVKDRPSRVHEYVFLFSKEERYYYDYEAVKEWTKGGDRTRSLRSVWSVNTEPFADAHFATYPPALIEPCIKAGSEVGDEVLDPFFGAATTGVVAARTGRNFTGIELNPEYLAIGMARLSKEPGVDVRLITGY